MDTDSIPVGQDKPDKQKEISSKADWKYLGVTNCTLVNPSIFLHTPTVSREIVFIPTQYGAEVFRPPQG